MKALRRALVAHAGWVLVGSFLLALWGAFFTVRLYQNLKTDIEELLPTTARSFLDLQEVTGRVESIQNLVILVFSQHTGGSLRFMNALAGELAKVDPAVISSVEYRVDRELDFFKKRRSLFIELEDLKKIRKFVHQRIDFEKELYNPLNIVSEAEIPEPHLDFAALQAKYKQKTQGFEAYPKGYYATPDEQMRLMVVSMPGKGLGIAKAMKAAIIAAVERVNPIAFAPDLVVKYTSNVEDMLEESDALVADLELSTVVVTVLVAVVMLIFFRSFWATVLLNISLFCGTFWTFGLAHYFIGYLNANSAFLASIIIGNGINVGIIVLARYLEERRKGKGHEQALEVTFCNTWGATVTAASAAALSYGSLVLTGFRGFSQFGMIGFMGMVLCWVSAYTVLPALLTVFQRAFGDRWLNLTVRQGWLSHRLAAGISRYPASVLSGVLLLSLASLMMLPRVKEGLLLLDLNQLRDKRCMTQGSGSLYHYLHEVFKMPVSPVVILPQTEADTQRIAQALKAESKRPGSMIASVQTLDDFVPSRQLEKVVILKEIQSALPPRMRAALSAGHKHQVDELLQPESLRPFTRADLPALLLKKFSEKDHSLGKIILVDKIYDQKHDSFAVIEQFVVTLRTLVDKIVTHAPIAGQLPINYDIFKAVERDGPKATSFALVAVSVLVVILFRHVRTIGCVLLALFLGVLWLAGLMLALRLKINFLNFIALPITFGIGVDYGVNIFQRYREAGPGKIVEVIQESGGAVLLVSLTTMIGYSSLLLAGNQAFVSFGVLSVLGEVTCVTAAVVALPAFLRFRDLQAEKKAEKLLAREAAQKAPLTLSPYRPI